MKYFLIFLSILSTVLVALFFILFTQSGNNLLKPYVEEYLKKQLKKDVKIEAFTLKTNFLDLEVNIDRDSKVILNGDFDFFKESFEFDYIVDGKNLKTPYIDIFEPLHVEGKFVGNLKEYQINGMGKAFRSNIRFFVDLEEKTIKNIKLDAKNVKMEDLLSILKKPIYTKGMFDINIDVKQTQNSMYKGNGNVQIHYGVIDSRLLEKDFGIKTLKAMTYKGKIVANIDGDTIISKTDIISNVAKIDMEKSKYNIKDKSFKSDYKVFLPNMDLLQTILDIPLQGSALFEGDIEQDEKNFSFSLNSDILNGVLKAVLYNDSLKVDLENASLSSLMKMFKKPKYSDGKFSINIDMNDIKKGSKNGLVLLHVEDGKLYASELKNDKDLDEVIPYRLQAQAEIKNDKANYDANFISDIALLTLQNAEFDLNSLKTNGDYELNIADLKKVSFLTSHELKGEFNLTGKYSYEDNLYVDGSSNFLDANSTFTLKDSLFHLKSDELSIVKLTDMLMYPRVFDSFSSLIFDYNLQTQQGELKVNALNGKILKSELTEIIFLASKFDLTSEVYKDTLLNAKIDKKQVNFTLLMNGLESYFKVPDGFVDLEKNVIDSDFEVQIEHRDFKGSINGTLDKPEIILDDSAYIRKKIDRAIEKNLPKEWQDTAKELLKLFG